MNIVIWPKCVKHKHFIFLFYKMNKMTKETKIDLFVVVVVQGANSDKMINRTEKSFDHQFLREKNIAVVCLFVNRSINNRKPYTQTHSWWFHRNDLEKIQTKQNDINLNKKFKQKLMGSWLESWMTLMKWIIYISLDRIPSLYTYRHLNEANEIACLEIFFFIKFLCANFYFNSFTAWTKSCKSKTKTIKKND